MILNRNKGSIFKVSLSHHFDNTSFMLSVSKYMNSYVIFPVNISLGTSQYARIKYACTEY